jgi:hypothetical protein
MLVKMTLNVAQERPISAGGRQPGAVTGDPPGRGISRPDGGALLAWFADPRCNILSVLQEREPGCARSGAVLTR